MTASDARTDREAEIARERLWAIMLDNFPHQHGTFISECRAMLARIAELSATVERVRALHRPIRTDPDRGFCACCDRMHPCPTVRVLSGDTEKGTPDE